MRSMLVLLVIVFFFACTKGMQWRAEDGGSTPGDGKGEPFYAVISKRLLRFSRQVPGSMPLNDNRVIGLVFLADSLVASNKDSLAIATYQNVFAGYLKKDILAYYNDIEIDYWTSDEFWFVKYSIDTSVLFRGFY